MPLVLDHTLKTSSLNEPGFTARTGLNSQELHCHSEEGECLAKIRIPSERSKGRKLLGRQPVVSASEWTKDRQEETEREASR